MTDTTYQPKPGDSVLVTLRATVDERGDYISYGAPRGGSACVYRDAEWIVRVEPAPVELPTGFGARIRATVTVDGEATPGVLLVHCPCHGPGSDPYPWFAESLVHDRRWVANESLSDVVVLDAGEPS